MIYDANGKSVGLFPLRGDALESLNASILESLTQEAFFTRDFIRESLLVDSRGNPFPSALPPIGSTITVKRPERLRTA